MSHRLFPEDIKFAQRFLTAAGFAPGPITGIWTAQTDDALHQFHRQTQAIREELGAFDPCSEHHLATLLPQAQRIARQCLARWNHTPQKAVRIISGTRSTAQQAALFKQGRYGDNRPRVTNAKGGQSTHNFGLAWDIGIFHNGEYITAEAPYIAAAHQVLAPIPNLEWGGNWAPFPDRPHYHISTPHPILQLRTRFNTGLPIL